MTINPNNLPQRLYSGDILLYKGKRVTVIRDTVANAIDVADLADRKYLTVTRSECRWITPEIEKEAPKEKPRIKNYASEETLGNENEGEEK